MTVRTRLANHCLPNRDDAPDIFGRGDEVRGGTQPISMRPGRLCPGSSGIVPFGTCDATFFNEASCRWRERGDFRFGNAAFHFTIQAVCPQGILMYRHRSLDNMFRGWHQAGHTQRWDSDEPTLRPA